MDFKTDLSSKLKQRGDWIDWLIEMKRVIDIRCNLKTTYKSAGMNLFLGHNELRTVINLQDNSTGALNKEG